MSTSRSIIVLLLVAVAASPREAVVVPVGPKTRNESWVESETQTYGVVRQQNFTYFGYHASPWRSFAGRRSGMSKPAFVRWLADSKYVAAWHVEEDVFFTGRWRDLFAAAPPGADLVARFSLVNSTWNPSPAW